MSDSLPPKEKKCHCTGFAKSCRALVTSGACSNRWQLLQGLNPQTKETINLWECVDNHIPTLLMSIGKATNELGAATESFRNQVTKIGRKQIEQRDRALQSMETANKALPGAQH